MTRHKNRHLLFDLVRFWGKCLLTTAAVAMVTIGAASKVQAAQSPLIAPMVQAGAFHTCVLDAGEVKCWGLNGFGQLGLGDVNSRGDGAGEMGDALLAVDLGAGVTATAIAAGGYHSCALLSSGAVKCWGWNNVGQLGVGDTNNRGDGGVSGAMGDDLPTVDLGTGVTATAISAGNNHTCALLSSGAVKCWGWNSAGQLGLGDRSPRGDGGVNGAMGDDLPTVDLGTGVTATAISAGGYHTCALLSSGAVKCWGSNGGGQLGLGDTDQRGDDVGQMGNALPAVDLGTGVTATAISAGGVHTCALLSSGAVKCWGWNSAGQLGVGDTHNRGDGGVNGAMGDDLPAVELGAGVITHTISARWDHTCALLSSGAVKCWGWNDFGQLGLGDMDPRGDDVGQMGNALPAVDVGDGVTAITITGGNVHTCALLLTGAVKCWGDNDYGQIGVGDTLDRGDAAGEMGDSLLSAFQVTRFSQTVAFDVLPDRQFAATPFTVSASSSLNLAMTLTSNTPTVCSTSGFEVTMLQTGVCSLTARQPGVVPHVIAAEGVQTFTIMEPSTPLTPSTLSPRSTRSIQSTLPSTGGDVSFLWFTGLLILGGCVTVLYSNRRTE